MKPFYTGDLNPPIHYLSDDDGLWVKVEDDYMHLGHAPWPRNRAEWLVHDICHGLIMRYPLWKVVGFSIQMLIEGRHENE